MPETPPVRPSKTIPCPAARPRIGHIRECPPPPPGEKAWLRSSNIFLLGDFNCDFSLKPTQDNAIHRNTGKLQSIFEMFNMHNVIQEATRSTITHIFHTARSHCYYKKGSLSTSGAFPLGISDNNLIYATIRLKNKRPPPKIIRTRNYKKMDVEKFKHDIESTPFHIASIFEDPDDQLWAWERLFFDLCDDHAPWKEVKARSFSSPWITSDIRYKTNRRYKLFIATISSKCQKLWSDYKRARNEVTVYPTM